MFVDLKNKFYFDEIYYFLFVKTTRLISCFANYIDQKLIDKCGPHGVSSMVNTASKLVSRIQTGYICNYALYIIFALVMIITFYTSELYLQIGVK